MRGHSIIFFIVYVVFGAYLLNSVLAFYPLPEFFPNLDKFVIAVSGILLIMASFKFFKSNSRKKYKDD